MPQVQRVGPLADQSRRSANGAASRACGRATRRAIRSMLDRTGGMARGNGKRAAGVTAIAPKITAMPSPKSISMTIGRHRLRSGAQCFTVRKRMHPAPSSQKRLGISRTHSRAPWPGGSQPSRANPATGPQTSGQASVAPSWQGRMRRETPDRTAPRRPATKYGRRG